MKVYEGNSRSSSKIICTIDDDKVYEGNSRSSSKVICNMRNGKIYEGNYTSSSKVICRIGGDKISGKIDCSFSDRPDNIEIIAVLYVLEMLDL